MEVIGQAVVVIDVQQLLKTGKPSECLVSESLLYTMDKVVSVKENLRMKKPELLPYKSFGQFG